MKRAHEVLQKLQDDPWELQRDLRTFVFHLADQMSGVFYGASAQTWTSYRIACRSVMEADYFAIVKFSFNRVTGAMNDVILILRHLTYKDVDTLKAFVSHGYDIHLETAGLLLGSRHDKPSTTVGSPVFIYRLQHDLFSKVDVLRQKLLTLLRFSITNVLQSHVKDYEFVLAMEHVANIQYTASYTGPEYAKEVVDGTVVNIEPEFIISVPPRTITEYASSLLDFLSSFVSKEISNGTFRSTTVNLDGTFLEISLTPTNMSIQTRYISGKALSKLLKILPADSLRIQAYNVESGHAVAYHPDVLDASVYEVTFVLPPWYMEQTPFGTQGRLRALKLMARGILPSRRSKIVASYSHSDREECIVNLVDNVENLVDNVVSDDEVEIVEEG